MGFFTDLAKRASFAAGSAEAFSIRTRQFHEYSLCCAFLLMPQLQLALLTASGWRTHHEVSIMTMWPNKSPEPTAVGAVSSAVAVHVASRRWLSFFR